MCSVEGFVRAMWKDKVRFSFWIVTLGKQEYF